MPLDYFVWAIVGPEKTFVVDTGFGEAVAHKRGRTITRSVEQGLSRIGIDPAQVEDVIITHLHFDHAGNHELFPRATYHVQDREMAYCTGRCMCHGALSKAFEVDDVKAMVDRVFSGRVQFHDGTGQLAPGVSLHRIGGHTDGLQVVRVHTARGWIVLASDATHFYANIHEERPYPIVNNVGAMLDGFRTLVALASSPSHVIPGHDPLVLAQYPAYDPESQGWIARLSG
ncbi:N-acyl homoserine lactonase family protein [Burkholderia sp. Ax-1719]|nr:N-acyl homoserine lactonase family protein [Burkholderia sp. Ax-1719]